MLAQATTLVLALAASLASALPANTSPNPHVEARANAGRATVYLQNGAYGSCGSQHADGDMIAALGHDWMQHQYKSPYCGRRLRLTNTGSPDVNVKGKGNSIEVIVQDSCDGCDRNHVDLSVGAWNKLTSNSAYSTVNIDWDFI